MGETALAKIEIGMNRRLWPLTSCSVNTSSIQLVDKVKSSAGLASLASLLVASLTFAAARLLCLLLLFSQGLLHDGRVRVATRAPLGGALAGGVHSSVAAGASLLLHPAGSHGLLLRSRRSVTGWRGCSTPRSAWGASGGRGASSAIWSRRCRLGRRLVVIVDDNQLVLIVAIGVSTFARLENNV